MGLIVVSRRFLAEMAHDAKDEARAVRRRSGRSLAVLAGLGAGRAFFFS